MTTFKDRLHDIFIDHYGEKLLGANSKVMEQAIINLFLEIVDSATVARHHNPLTNEAIDLVDKAELRNKLKGDN